jgi:hypothetical protein
MLPVTVIGGIAMSAAVATIDAVTVRATPVWAAVPVQRLGGRQGSSLLHHPPGSPVRMRPAETGCNRLSEPAIPCQSS